MVVLVEDGTAYAWGCNDRGRLGDGTTDDQLSPKRIAGLDEMAEAEDRCPSQAIEILRQDLTK